ncbi:acetyltransferase, GNAT family [Ancylostoma caninum]|uniref:Acetyltransferase, GNAT family n=1 Tax=Ancylostoma caninum TaxID=29170 RepID=A0A368FNQ4_ANCCA|nr:acetyltransferase, GNAT family [Ancylostoma caninum]
MAVSVSRATSADAAVLMGMIRELAEFEKMPEAVKIDETRLAADLDENSVGGFVLREGDEPAAMLLFYFAYSTWEGQFIHMEDLYVRPAFRRKGYGQRLWRELGILAKEMGVLRDAFGHTILQRRVARPTNALHLGMAVSVSRATSADAAVLMGMIRELAEFEKMPEAVKIDETRLAADLDENSVGGFVLREGDEPAAMLLFYFAYSTWEGQFIHMEDLYVRPAFRRKGYGQRLWRELGILAKEMGVLRIQWDVLDWNSNAIAFYEKMPCENLTKKEGWLLYRLNANGIAALAEAKTKC